uniref:Pilus assembly protein PilP n=1 Tax=candidate division WOR-3 bacterium TaxID=2052148 RepID=A0A7C3N5E3_UNCW3
MLKRKNRSILLLSLTLFLIFSFISCSRGNPVNSAIEKSSKALTPKDNTKTTDSLVSNSDTNVETQNQETVSDSLPYDTTTTLPFTIETYTFKTKTKNDPFVSILEQQREGKIQIDIESAMYFGMIKGKNGKLALLKDASGLGFIFYEGQKIKNGILLKIEQDSVIFKLDEYGVVRNKVIKLVKNIDTKKKK